MAMITSSARRLFRSTLVRAAYLVLRPFGTISVRISGVSARFHFDSLDEMRRIRGLAGERDIFTRLIELVRPGDNVWDVGGNIGTHTVLLAKRVGPGGSVLAFEPETATADRLWKNVELNSLSNVELRREALGTENAEHEFSVDDRPGSGKHSLLDADGFRKTVVQVRRGDSVADERPGSVPSVVKIDVEGFEAGVLAGMPKTLANPKCRLVLCEVHTRQLEAQGIDPASIRETLAGAGFVKFEEFPRGNEVHLLASK